MSRSDEDTRLSDALTDVRRAYRLLWAYQQRVIFYNDVIQKRLIFSPIKVDYWVDRYKDKTDIISPTASMWRYLPFAYIGFLSARHAPNKPRRAKKYNKIGDMFLYATVSADSSLEDRDLNDALDSDPQNFRMPEQCESQIFVYLGVNLVDKRLDNFWGENLDDDGYWPDDKRVITVDDIRIYGETWNMVELPDQRSLLKKIDSFRNGVKKKLRVDLM